jgi:protein ImuA
VHEIVGEGRSEVRDAACFGFTMALLARQRTSSAGAVGSNQTGSNQAGPNQAGRDQILWCPAPGNRSGGRIHGRGLATYGLDPDKIIWVDARDRADRLWAMEQALACPGLLAAVIELEAGPGGRSQERRDVVERRLQLAAEAGGVLGLVLRPMADAGSGSGGGIADTRWEVRSAASDDWQPTWHVALRRVRGGVGGDWLLRWDAAARNFHAYVCEKPNAGTAFGTDFRQSRALT